MSLSGLSFAIIIEDKSGNYQWFSPINSNGEFLAKLNFSEKLAEDYSFQIIAFDDSDGLFPDGSPANQSQPIQIRIVKNQSHPIETPYPRIINAVNGQITLGWQKLENAKEYRIYHQDFAGVNTDSDYIKIHSDKAYGAINGLINGKKHYLKVMVVSNDGNWSISDEIALINSYFLRFSTKILTQFYSSSGIGIWVSFLGVLSFNIINAIFNFICQVTQTELSLP